MGKSGNSQRGITFVGLLFVAIVVGAAALVGMKVFPVILEHRTIASLVTDVARAGSGSSVPDIRRDFDKRKTAQYGVNLQGSDLVITKEDDRVVVSFDYEREVELIDPVFLLFKFKGHSR